MAGDQKPPPQARSGISVYLVSCLLFIAIVTGGAFLVLYVTLPESEDTIWFPIAGVALVGIPWLFWITTCLYRTVPAREDAAKTMPVTTSVDEDAAVDSPGGGRKIRFGNATAQEVPGGGGGGGYSSQMANGKGEAAGGDSHGTHRSTVSKEDGMSLTSHDSELPLFP